MSGHEFWKEAARLTKAAKRAAFGNNVVKYVDAYMRLVIYLAEHAPSKQAQRFAAKASVKLAALAKAGTP